MHSPCERQKTQRSDQEALAHSWAEDENEQLTAAVRFGQATASGKHIER